MAKNTSVILGDHFEAFIAEQLEGGQYTNASEVVREALRYMQTQKKKEKALLEALDAGLASSGPSLASLRACAPRPGAREGALHRAG